jgi:hypothetical protein
MTLAFPFSGSRGGWFHSGAALQPLLWALAPVGLDHLVDWAGRKRNWRPNRPYLVFSIALVLITALVTWIGYRRIVTGPDAAAPAWNASYRRAVEAGSLLKAQGADPEDIVLVNNAPGFFAATGFSGATIPDGDVQSVLEAARRVQATYLLLDENTVKSLRPLYQDPHNLAGLDLLAVREGLQVYRIEETQ